MSDIQTGHQPQEQLQQQQQQQQQHGPPSMDDQGSTDSNQETEATQAASLHSERNGSASGDSLIARPTSSMLTGTSDVMSSPIRVPGTYPPEWLPDHETDTCMACGTQFTLIKRRHHCRSCGKIFCGDCCKLKAKLLYMDNKEARVCNNCHNLIERTLANSGFNETRSSTGTHSAEQRDPAPSDSQPSSSDNTALFSSSPSYLTSRPGTSTGTKRQGVLKTSNPAARLSGALNDLCDISNSSSSDQHSNKQVTFSDGIRPGTDLSEPYTYPASPSSNSDSPTNSSFPMPSRQNRITGSEPSAASTSTSNPTTLAISPEATNSNASSSSIDHHKRSRGDRSSRNITVCDEIGYLPPVVISKDLPISSGQTGEENAPPNTLTSLIMNQFKASKKSIQASMESRASSLNGFVKFGELSELLGVNHTITFLLLKSFYVKVKIVRKTCCMDKKWTQSLESVGNCDQPASNLSDELEAGLRKENDVAPEYWCFLSSGLDKLGQDEIMIVLDKDKGNSCIPRDIFKIYLTLHELALRRQAIENLGNLLFQDGLFGSRDTAGLVFVQPSRNHCLYNLILPDNKFLIALVLQRWEVPWSKVFPMRLLLRLGHKYDVFPYPIVSYRTREPVFYEIGHTIISILGDFRNFRYSLTHVDGLQVMLDKTSRKVTVQLHQSNYVQFSKVLDSSNNEHVLAWSACPFLETDGHLVTVQNDEGQYETVEFYKQPIEENISFKNLETGPVLGASFVVFSGALKMNQSGQPAKISIVEDGLLIQIQSCTMSALRNAIRYMDDFDIDCENAQDPLNRVEIRWQARDM